MKRRFCTFNLNRLSDASVRAIIEALRIDRENVLAVDFNRADCILRVEPATMEAAEQINNFVSGLIRRQKLVSRKVVRRNQVETAGSYDVDHELAFSKDVQILDHGLTGLRGDLLALFRFFEREFLRVAREFGAEENHYPVMMPREALEEVGYFEHFPSQVTFCTHLRESLPLFEAVAAEGRAGSELLSKKFGDCLTAPHYVLIPSVCFPCYRQHRGLVLPEGEVLTLTMQNHVFRHEGGNFRPLTRAWDFTVRDIVFFGSGEDMVRLRNEVMDRIIEFCRELDLAVTIELANDPFFLNASRDKAVYQRLGEVKYELLFDLPHRGESLAASSFNLHRDFYTSVYDIRLSNGALAESACVGFGLERWLYGFLSQKGSAPCRWPQRVSAAPK